MRLVAIAAALLLLATPAFAGRRIDEYVSGYWTTYAYQNDDGSFGHCGMETRFDNGMKLGILLADNGVNIVFLHNAWNLQVGGKSALQIKIDRRYNNYSSLEFTDRDVMIASLGFDPKFWSAFKAGLNMQLDVADGRSWSVNLRGSNKATQALTVCYDLYSPSGRKGMFK